MNDIEIAHGLFCPRCGGMVPVPEGQVVVTCPFCDLRSLVRGERGLQRYQVSQRVDRENAIQALRKFLGGSLAIARDAAKNSRLEEAFVVHLPFWASWARVFGWTFGEKRVGSGDSRHYEPREVKSYQDMNWNGAACDVGEFGVQQISLAGRSLAPFNPGYLHDSGMVFEPVGSQSDAVSAAQENFRQRIKDSSKLDRVSQVFIRKVQERMGLVYYPLWVLRYLYRNRSFQMLVDGFSGEVLYGKAPGSTAYRAAVLVGGMALGGFLSIDGSALGFYLASQSDGDGAGYLFMAGVIAFVIGVGIAIAAYQAFRHGEHYEYRRDGKNSGAGSSFKDITSQAKDLTSWINQ